MQISNNSKGENMTREEFKRFAAGQFVLGKASVDTKELETFVNGAVFAWDELNKRNVSNKLQDAFIKFNETKDGYAATKPA